MQLAYNNKGIHLTISIQPILSIVYTTLQKKVFMQKSPFSSEIIVIQSNSSNIQLVANLFISLNLNRRNIFKDSS